MTTGKKYSKQFKKHIIQLRKKGLSYNDIRKKTGVPISTLSLWLKNVSLSPIHTKRLYTKQIALLTKGPQSNKERRAREIERVREKAKKDIIGISEETYMIAGAIMYWAEGAKTGDARITNSDPRVVKFMVKWLNDVCGWPPEHLKARVHIHEKDTDQQIQQYWSQQTGIPLKNFGKSFVKPKGTGHRTNILPNGILQIRPAGKGSTDLRHRILAWSEKFYEKIITRP